MTEKQIIAALQVGLQASGCPYSQRPEFAVVKRSDSGRLEAGFTAGDQDWSIYADTLPELIETILTTLVSELVQLSKAEQYADARHRENIVAMMFARPGVSMDKAFEYADEIIRSARKGGSA